MTTRPHTEDPPPSAPTRPHQVTHHGITVEDEYHWLKDPDYPEVTNKDVLGYLAAENAYFEQQMSAHSALVDQLFAEIKGRQPKEDAGVPFLTKGWWYQWRYLPDAQYRTWYRAPEHAPTDWQVLLDEPGLARGHEYFRLGGFAVSPDGKLLAYSTDTSGAERFTLFVTRINSGAEVVPPIPDTIDSPVWSRDSHSFFYAIVNEQWRPFEIRRHDIGKAGSDAVVYTETDESFFVSVSETHSEAFVVISTGDHVTSESYLVPAERPHSKPQVVSPRRTGHEYHVEHRLDELFVRTNRDHKNFAVTRVALTSDLTGLGEDAWDTVIPGSHEHYIIGLVCFADFTVVAERIEGLDQIRIINLDNSEHYVQFPESTFDVGLGTNPNFAATELRLGYTSMVTPSTVYDYTLETRELIVRKVQEIPTGYNADLYQTERLMVPARDGTRVPVSIVYRKGFARDGCAPLYLYGYGAYGLAIPPGFSASRLSLLDRGYAFAIAHIRGGDDLGYHWYEDGKLAKRTNTFNDFVDVARHLIDQEYSSAGRLCIAGGSAGGELMGAVVNQAPDLWGAVALHVPFVDVLNTMLDDSLPLTPMEWPEWGNPLTSREDFELIQSYSPYDQLQPGEFPPMLVTAGLNDPRVTYWEPAKYVARIRAIKTDNNLLLLKTNMGAGHGGKSGRFDSLHEVAEEYAFFLVSLGLA